MGVLFKTSVAAALSLILGTGVLATRAAAITVAGRDAPATCDWETVSNSAAHQDSTGVNASFENNSPLSVSFTQLSVDAVASVEIQKTTPCVLPPAEDGGRKIESLGYESAVKYSGMRLCDPVSSWSETTNDENMMIAADPGTAAEFPAFILGATPTVNEVRTPLAAWQSLTGLGLVIMFTIAIRPARPVLH